MTSSSSSRRITFKVLLPQINHPLSGPPPTPRVNISGPTTLKSFPLQRIDFLNSDLKKLILKRPASILKCKKVLGHGDGGSVYEVRYPLMKESYALKVVERVSAFHSTDKFGKDGIRTEITLAKRLQHPHITDFKAVFCDLDHHYLLTEACAHGSLQTFLNDVRVFNEPESRLLMLQVVSAVNYLHQLGVSHNDVYPRNILVGQGSNDKGLALKLSDFGWSEIQGPENHQFDSSMSDLLYTGWSTETDLELLPEILLHLLFNLVSIKPADIQDLSGSSHLLKSLLGQILSNLRKSPPNSISQFLAHPWFSEGECFIRKIPFVIGRAACQQPTYKYVDRQQSEINRREVLQQLGLQHFFRLE